MYAVVGQLGSAASYCLLMAHELVIKGGSVVDGTGAPAASGDVGIDDGVITQVGGALEGDRVIDADGALVTPGLSLIHI